MIILFTNFNKIKEVFTETLEKKAIRIANRGDIDIFIRDRIFRLKKNFRKGSITEKTITKSWVPLFELKYNTFSETRTTSRDSTPYKQWY